MAGKGRPDRAVQLDELSRFADGLYIELDKLSKKDPYAEISDLARRRLNRAIEEARALLPEDHYLSGIDKVPAEEENPEARDALLMLQEIRQAIARSEAAERRRIYGR